MLRNLATMSGGVRRPLPGSSRSAVLLTSRQSSRAAKAKAEDAAARAARVPNRGSGRPLAGPRTLPAKRVGLYDPALEKDSCGVGLAVQMKSVASRQVGRLSWMRAHMRPGFSVFGIEMEYFEGSGST